VPLLLLKYWPYLAAVLLIVAGGTYLHHKGVVSGRADVQAKWDADSKARDAAVAKAVADSRARETAAQETNRRIEDDYSKIISRAAGDRDTYFSLLQRARGEIRVCSAGQATSSTIAATSGEANISERIDRAIANTISEHLSNSAQLDALIAVVKPQL